VVRVVIVTGAGAVAHAPHHEVHHQRASHQKDGERRKATDREAEHADDGENDENDDDQSEVTGVVHGDSSGVGVAGFWSMINVRPWLAIRS
jgi:hypothetical protein